MKLHHCAYKIFIGNSQLIQEFCEFLGARLIWEGEDEGREIAMKFENGFCIQFSEFNEKPVNSKNKVEAHFALSSDNPKKDLEKIRNWFESRDIETRIGKWSNKELWIDCPLVFVDFAIEVLDTR